MERGIVKKFFEIDDEIKLLSFFMVSFLFYLSIYNELKTQHMMGFLISMFFLFILIEISSDEVYNLNKSLETKVLNIKQDYKNSFKDTETIQLHDDANIVLVINEMNDNYGNKNKEVMGEIIKYTNFILYMKSKIEEEKEFLNQVGKFQLLQEKILELEKIIISMKPVLTEKEIEKYTQLGKKLIVLIYRQLDTVKYELDKKMKEYNIPDIIPDYDFVKKMKK